jgi:type VI secretion system protein VasG
MKTPSLRNALLAVSKEFEKVKYETLSEKFDEVVGGSPEDAMVARDGFQVGGGAVPGEASGAVAPAQMGKQEALRQFSVDLTERARNGEIDPIVGRDEEIRQIVDILMRRRQNNPIITGEAGVGKTAVVEGFALKIASGDVPPSMQDVTLRSLDIGLLQAGASMKGEFENRLRQVIEEVQSSEKPIIMFIDEAHTLIGAGGAAGTGDAANLLKPALARGTLRTIAATTWAEYKKHIEKDPALTRRFQVIQVDEPSEDKAILMMRGMATTLEKHHQAQVMDEALEASVSLSHRYIPARQLPDKSISLLDTACARVAISQHAIPAEVDDSRRRIEALDREMAIIQKEKAVGVDTDEREAECKEKLAAEHDRLEGLEARFEEEKGLVDQILEIRATLRGDVEKVEGTESELEQAADEAAEQEETVDAPAMPDTDREKLFDELHGLQGKLEELQGEHPLILPSVDYQAVASVVADWTGIPVGRMVKNQAEAVLKLADTLNERVIGQRHGLDMIARRVQTSRAKLDNPNKPIGVFLLAGPSGVGKTETALAIAETLYGGEQNVVTINMSEFQEAHTVSTLKGAPPGYVGYGEGGILTEAVRRKPYSVVLLDEVEKAHSDVHEIFFQVFDKGIMEDGEGRLIDFKNTLILLTSNVGSDLIMNMCQDPELMPEPEGIAKALREPLLQTFPAALLGRLVVIPYYPLTDEVIGLIAKLQLKRIANRVEEGHKIPFTYDDAVIEQIIERCTELESGGRMIDSILTNTVLPAISTEFLTRMMEGKEIEKVHVVVKDGEFSYEF